MYAADPFACYVRGCKAPIVGGALHSAFGRVLCCASHWPDRGARGRVFGEGATPAPIVLDHFAVPAAPPEASPVLTLERGDVPDPF